MPARILDIMMGDISFRKGEITNSLLFSLQALLVRHEAYIVEAEESRRQMSLRIDSLETDKRNLEAENARTVQENRDLLSHLEQLNGAIADSESRAGNLEATLQGTLLEMKRLDSLASRTHDLEAQLAELEKEQDDLRETVVLTEAESRTAVRRWREAERRLGEVQDQLERIEREASEEKARHEEVFRRMERQKLVDKAIQDTSNGKVAVLNAGQGKEGTNVVSHFVKDILQDNVNLQMGIVELRDMLTTSNDEVQKLRDQLMAHQPVRDGAAGENNVPVTLAAELTVKEPLSLSQELHVHHHYHAPAKKEENRRAVPKRKRNVSITTPTRLNGRGHSTRQSQSSIAATILSQTSSTVPSPRTTNRWSTQSEFASTEPSSPTSNYRNSFLFDRMSVDQNTVLPACCPLACPAATEYKCPSSLGGKCCSLGATCVSDGCVATLPPTTSTTSSSIPSCATSNIPCTDGLGGCCNSGAHCTTVQSTGYCASGSAAPTELRIGGKTGDEIVEKPRSGGGLSSGAKAGIGAGVAIGALLVIGAAVWWWISRRRQAGGSAPRGSGRGSGPWGSARGGTETVVSMQQGSTPGGPDMAGRGTEDYFGPTAGIGPFTGAEGAGMTRSGAVPVSPDQPGDIQPAVEIGEALGRPTPVSPGPSTRHEYWKHGAKTVGERVELE